MKLYYYRLENKIICYPFLMKGDDDLGRKFEGPELYGAGHFVRDEEGYWKTIDLIFTFDPDYRVIYPIPSSAS